MATSEENVQKQPSTKRRAKVTIREIGPNREAMETLKTKEHPLWPKFEVWAQDRIPTLMWALWWECFLEGHKATQEFYEAKMLQGSTIPLPQEVSSNVDSH